MSRRDVYDGGSHQYFDEETHLHENWNRYYDPVVGQYTSIEPMLSPVASLPDVQIANLLVGPSVRRILGGAGGATFALSQARSGTSAPAYAYATNNPVANFDPNGDQMVPGQMTNPPGPFENNPPPGWLGPRPPDRSPNQCGGNGSGPETQDKQGGCFIKALLYYGVCRAAGFQDATCRAWALGVWYECMLDGPPN